MESKYFLEEMFEILKPEANNEEGRICRSFNETSKGIGLQIAKAKGDDVLQIVAFVESTFLSQFGCCFPAEDNCG
jgi:hypothetical protein